MGMRDYMLGRIKALEVIKSQCENEIKQLQHKIKLTAETEDDRWVATPWGFIWL